MRENNRYCVWAMLALLLMVIWMGTAEKSNGQDIPEEVIIDKGLYRTDIYEGVRFSHGAHILEFEIACSLCHHTWNREESISPVKCSLCHEVRDTEKIALRDAYMNNCRGCHGRLKIEGKPAGPTRCNECHSKKKRMR